MNYKIQHGGNVNLDWIFNSVVGGFDRVELLSVCGLKVEMRSLWKILELLVSINKKGSKLTSISKKQFISSCSSSTIEKSKVFSASLEKESVGFSKLLLLYNRSTLLHSLELYLKKDRDLVNKYIKRSIVVITGVWRSIFSLTEQVLSIY